MRDLSSSEVLQERKSADHRHYQCPVCGQTVDRRDLEQVYYHDCAPHGPRAPDANRYE
jgi:hypothetical protein